MFLDEPTTGLDPRSPQPVWDIIRALVAGGKTMLLWTHYMDEADRLSRRVAIIDHGKVMAEGTPGQLKASVGSGALRVRLLDPEQRPEAERVLSRELGSVHLEPDPSALSVSHASVAIAPPRPSPSWLARDVRIAPVLARAAEPRRGLPGPDGTPGRGSQKK